MAAFLVMQAATLLTATMSSVYGDNMPLLRVCCTCRDYFVKGQVPPLCIVNSLTLDPIPPELACLNTVELRLITQVLHLC